MNKAAGVFAAVLALSSLAAIDRARADESRSYTEGPVTIVSAIRTKPGQFEKYMKWLDTVGKQLRDEEKKSGIILDYAVYSALPQNPHDPDIYLTVTYKNFAALDGLDDKEEPIMKRIWATHDESSKAEVDRESLREILGTQVIRKLDLK